MTKEALKLALQLISNLRTHSWTVADEQLVITAIKEALAQPEQEPVAWSYWQSCLNDDGTQTAPWVHRLSKFKPTESIINKDVTPLYTTPPQRTWVGLTDEEILDNCESVPDYDIGNHDLIKFARSIEAKIRSKND